MREGTLILYSYWNRIKASPIAYRLARGTFWSLVGAATSRALQLASTVLVARIIGRNAYGELGIIQNTVGLFGVFAGLGMGLTAAKHVAEFRSSDPIRAGRVIGLTRALAVAGSAAALVVLVFGSGILAEHFLAAPHLKNMLLIGGLLIPFSALAGVQTGSLSGLEAFGAIARVNFVGGLASFPLMIAGAYTAGVTGALVGLIGSQSILCMLNHAALKEAAGRFRIPLRFSGFFEERKIVWNFSCPAAFGNLATWAASCGAYAILVNQAGGYGEMAVINVGNHWRAALLFVPALLTNAALPVLASEGSIASAGSRQAMEISHRFIVLLVLPVALCLVSVAGLILQLYGPGFEEGRTALVYFLAATAVSAVSSPIGSAIVAAGRMWLSLGLNSINAIVFVGLTLVLAPARGAEGVGAAYFAGHLVQAVLGSICMWTLLPNWMFVRNIAAIILLSITAAVFVSW